MLCRTTMRSRRITMTRVAARMKIRMMMENDAKLPGAAMTDAR